MLRSDGRQSLGQGRAQRSALAQIFRGSASSARGPARLTPGRERELTQRRAKVRGAAIEPTRNAASEEES